jgi:hypothetical protein
MLLAKLRKIPKKICWLFKRKNLVCVLGMHRSGTSALAHLVGMSGAYLGEDEQLLLGSRDENPKGFFEHSIITCQNDDLLTANGFVWSDVTGFSFDALSQVSLEKYSEAVSRQLKQLFWQNSLICVKDPRMCLLLPLWKKYFGYKTVVVNIFRHPVEVAQSLQKRNDFTLEKGLALWEDYVTAQLASIKGVDNLSLLHADLLQQPRQTAIRLAQFLSKHSGGIHNANDHELNDFICTKLHRNKDQSVAALSSSQAALWRDCQALAANPNIS